MWKHGGILPISSSTSSKEVDAPIKWAHDAANGAVRYIHDNEVVTKTCSCVCPACNLPLTPVMAGKPDARPTAHFRHPAGAQKDTCTTAAARLAATQYLFELGYIDLPSRRISGSTQGFSGEHYTVWIESPAERRSINQLKLVDRTTAQLTLDDGRTLLVDLTGNAPSDDSPSGQALVTVALSSPELSSLSIEELRTRLRIFPAIHWCRHWEDTARRIEAESQARTEASEALDGWSAEDEADFLAQAPGDLDEAVGQQLRRETVLHRESKAILAKHKSILVPALDVSVTRHPPEELQRYEFSEAEVTYTWFTSPTKLELSAVLLERKLGLIVPDVVATLDPSKLAGRGVRYASVSADGYVEEEEDMECVPHQWPKSLLVEITVTHGIDAKKLRRIQALNEPVLEIDLSRLSGRVSTETLEDLLINQDQGKRWVHHPLVESRTRWLNGLLDAHPVVMDYIERRKALRRPMWLERPSSYWVEPYRQAVMGFHRKNVAIRKERRQATLDKPAPRELDQYSEEWSEILDMAEALEAHGLAGAADREMLSEPGLVLRLLSLELNTGIGYDVDSGYRVLDAIMQAAERNRYWDVLYATAVKAYELDRHFSDAQRKKYEDWRLRILLGVREGNPNYLRPRKYDHVLSEVFPELKIRLAGGYGLADGTG